MRCNGCGFDSTAAQVVGPAAVARAHRDVHLAKFPDLDPVSRQNLDDIATWNEERETEAPKAAGWSAGAEYADAREPGFYGSTYCVHCGKHLPVGVYGEFVWDDDSGQRVGT